MTLLAFMSLFEEFAAPSWAPWRTVLARLTPAVREFFAIVGRGAGKSRVVALIACYFAVVKEYRRAPGEAVYVGIFAPDRKQAAVTLRYVLGLLRSVPTFDEMIVREGADAIELSNGVIIEVITASISAPRGRSYAVAIVEEAAFLPTDDSANPDVELLRAVRPALARVPGSLLCVVGSPYARRGVMYDAWTRYHEAVPDDVLFLNAPTLDLNPAFDRQAVTKAYEEDEASARAEFGGEFRSDVEGFITREAIEAVTVKGRQELAPVPGVRYAAFVDFAGGTPGGDSLTAAVSYLDPHTNMRVLSAIREVRPPFSPEAAMAEVAAFLRPYNIRRVTGDRWAGEWPREACRKHGIDYEPSARTKSEIYLAALPLLNSGRVELLDHPRLLQQIAGLERRTARGGRDSVDHAPGRGGVGGGHDDVANAALGALALEQSALRGGVEAFEWATGRILEGWDVDGVEYRRGAVWSGVCPPNRDAKGRPVNFPALYHNGVIVQYLAFDHPAVLAAPWRRRS